MTARCVECGMFSCVCGSFPIFFDEATGHHEHIRAHEELIKAMETTRIHVRHSPHFWKNLFLTMLHGRKTVTFAEYMGECFAAIKLHIDEHARIHATGVTDKDWTK